jgi:hypothetical protein
MTKIMANTDYHTCLQWEHYDKDDNYSSGGCGHTFGFVSGANDRCPRCFGQQLLTQDGYLDCADPACRQVKCIGTTNYKEPVIDKHDCHKPFVYQNPSDHRKCGGNVPVDEPGCLGQIDYESGQKIKCPTCQGGEQIEQTVCGFSYIADSDVLDHTEGVPERKVLFPFSCIFPLRGSTEFFRGLIYNG